MGGGIRERRKYFYFYRRPHSLLHFLLPCLSFTFCFWAVRKIKTGNRKKSALQKKIAKEKEDNYGREYLISV